MTDRDVAAAAPAASTAPAGSAGPTVPNARTPSPGSMLGVLGGGQLGRMFIHAAQSQGFRVAVLEPDAASPAGAAADLQLRAAYDDLSALDELGRLCSAVTTEFENVPADALRRLAAAGRAVSPPAAAVEVCQHRAREKACFVAAGVACAPHASIAAATSGDELLARSADYAPLLPGILKTASLGYDGKGQATVATLSDLPAAHAALGGVECVLEKRLPLRREISAIVARGSDGRCVHLPVQQNLHRDGILFCTQVPAPDVDAATAARAVEMAERLASTLDYVGVLCVEFFVLEDGSLVANEMAPRPHNSGHHSIDSCDLSQFDLQLRTLVGLPLVQPRLHSPTVMLNLLGDLWLGSGDSSAAPSTTSTTPAAATAAAPAPAPAPGAEREPDWSTVLALPGVHLHLYGKSVPRPGRKMGHLTVTAVDTATARATALHAARSLGLSPF